MTNNEYYDRETVQTYLESIDAINDEYAKKMDRLIEKRDEKTSFYNKQILLEKMKPTQPIKEMFTNAIDTNAIDNLSTEQLNKVADILGVK
jgi:hypothetical protein|tara:strand:+ start:425 stop:697 length:273 start_codon:yes stop_codon:yes gene_type:complete